MPRSPSRLTTVAALCLAASATAQINYTEDFNLTAAGWDVFDGFENGHYLDNTACGGGGGNLRSNLYGGAPTCRFESPLIGIALGGPLIVSLDYKVHAWAANTVPVNPWGSFDLEISSNGLTWTNVGTVANDTVQTAICQSASLAFTPPPGNLWIRFVGMHTVGDYYLNIDNVSVETFNPCAGAPAPGDAIVVGELCNGTGTAELSLQNPTPGAGVSYQWYESSVSSTGPWNALGTNETETFAATGDTWFYCDVTCASGPTTTASNVGQIAAAPWQNPQTFDTSVTPNCWEVDAPASLAINWDDDHVEFDFYGAFNAGDEATHTSPVFPALPVTTPIYFDIAGQYYDGFLTPTADEVVLEESNDGGATWTPIVSMLNTPGGLANTAGGGSTSLDPTPGDWAARSFQLAAGTDRIRFRGISDYGNQVHIDNVSIGIPPGARHTHYGCSCPVELTSATIPVSPSVVVYDIRNVPEMAPGSGAGVGALIYSFFPEYTGVALSPLIDAECRVYVNALDVLVPFIATDGTAAVPLTLPLGLPAGTLFEQAVALVPATPVNTLGVKLSNGLRSDIDATPSAVAATPAPPLCAGIGQGILNGSSTGDSYGAALTIDGFGFLPIPANYRLRIADGFGTITGVGPNQITATFDGAATTTPGLLELYYGTQTQLPDEGYTLGGASMVSDNVLVHDGTLVGPARPFTPMAPIQPPGSVFALPPAPVANLSQAQWTATTRIRIAYETGAGATFLEFDAMLTTGNPTQSQRVEMLAGLINSYTAISGIAATPNGSSLSFAFPSGSTRPAVAIQP